MKTLLEMRTALASVQKTLSDVAHASYLIPAEYRAEFRRELAAAQLGTADAISTMNDSRQPLDLLDVDPE